MRRPVVQLVVLIHADVLAWAANVELLRTCSLPVSSFSLLDNGNCIWLTFPRILIALFVRILSLDIRDVVVDALLSLLGSIIPRVSSNGNFNAIPAHVRVSDSRPQTILQPCAPATPLGVSMLF